MRIKSFEIGVEQISQWNVGDEFHLPDDRKAAPTFLPQFRPLDEVLRRPSLDERLPDLLQPADLDPGLLEPSALAETRKGLLDTFSQRAAMAKGQVREAFSAAAALLEVDDGLDEEVRAALAVLLRG